MLNRAQSIKATRPQAAAALYRRIDHRLVDAAAWLPLVDDLGLDFVSARVHDYESNPIWGPIVDQFRLSGS